MQQSRNGIVLGFHDEYVVVLTQTGEFVRLPRNAAMHIGEEVEWGPIGEQDVPQAQVESSPHVPHIPVYGKLIHKSHGGPFQAGNRRVSFVTGFARTPWAKAVVLVAAALLVVVGAWWRGGWIKPQTASAYAFVSLDINPAIALTVDRQMRVLQVSANNPDGKALLAGVHVLNTFLPQAMTLLINAAVTQHLVPPADSIIVTTSPALTQANMARVQREALNSVNTAIQGNAQARSLAPAVYAFTVSPALWQAADAKDLSPGVIASYVIASQEGYRGSASQLHGTALASILQMPQARHLAQQLSQASSQQISQWLAGMQETASSGTGDNRASGGQRQAGAHSSLGTSVAVSSPHNPSASAGNTGLGHAEGKKQSSKGQQEFDGHPGREHTQNGLGVQVGKMKLQIAQTSIDSLPGFQMGVEAPGESTSAGRGRTGTKSNGHGGTWLQPGSVTSRVTSTINGLTGEFNGTSLLGP